MKSRAQRAHGQWRPDPTRADDVGDLSDGWYGQPVPDASARYEDPIFYAAQHAGSYGESYALPYAEPPRQRTMATSAVTTAPRLENGPVYGLPAGPEAHGDYASAPVPRRSGAPQNAAAPRAVDGDGHRSKRHLKVSYPMFVVLAVAIATRTDTSSMHVYSVIAITLLSIKMVLALFYRRKRATTRQQVTLDRMWVTAVIPIYNEDPAMFERGLRSLLAQSRLPNEIHIVDDASADPAGMAMARRVGREFEAAGVVFTVTVQLANKGKREALARGFQDAPYSDVFLCVDSDTILTRETIGELITPLVNEKVMAATGIVLALNHGANIFTRLQDLRYGNSFLFERAAYSQLGSVLCCCGALSAYRGTLVRKYLPDFLNQQFLGKPAVFGDDRRMTNYCLMEGNVVFQESAVGYTVVPERLPHFLRQQVRWNKSFFRESLWALRNQRIGRPAFWLTCMEVGLWVTFGTAMVYSLFVSPFLYPDAFAKHVRDYAIFMALMGYLRNVRYLDFPRRNMGLVKRFGMFLLAPLYGVIQLLLLTPLRVYALLTLHRGKWGTRQGGVEVTVAAAPS